MRVLLLLPLLSSPLRRARSLRVNDSLSLFLLVNIFVTDPIGRIFFAFAVGEWRGTDTGALCSARWGHCRHEL